MPTTLQEDDKIIEMRNQNKSWSDISKTFNGKRTDNHVRCLMC